MDCYFSPPRKCSFLDRYQINLNPPLPKSPPFDANKILSEFVRDNLPSLVLYHRAQLKDLYTFLSSHQIAHDATYTYISAIISNPDINPKAKFRYARAIIFIEKDEKFAQRLERNLKIVSSIERMFCKIFSHAQKAPTTTTHIFVSFMLRQINTHPFDPAIASFLMPRRVSIGNLYYTRENKLTLPGCTCLLQKLQFIQPLAPNPFPDQGNGSTEDD